MSDPTFEELEVQIGVPCAGGCGKRVVPVQAEDCGSQTGPWYCNECYDKEAARRRNEEHKPPRPTKSAFDAAIEAGEQAHLLTVGSPARGLCLRVALGRLTRNGSWRSWQPDVFLIWQGRRL